MGVHAIGQLQNWSSNIDNFEIAFDYDPPITPAPTPTPTPTQNPDNLAINRNDFLKTSSVLSSQDAIFVKSQNISNISYEIGKETESESRESCIEYSDKFLKLLACLITSLFK